MVLLDMLFFWLIDLFSWWNYVAPYDKVGTAHEVGHWLDYAIFGAIQM
jgi:hypothetical protein